MNDIEKTIEGDFEEEKEKETNIKPKFNQSKNNDKKKIIIYILLGIICLAIIGTIIYLIVGKKDNLKETKKEETQKEETKEENNDIKDAQKNNIGYVSCDDNTSLLNVRNSTNGDIIDGLSCYREVTIEEELEGTDNCNKWYKISYKKHDSSYTGYACATYIKESEIDTKTKKLVDDLYNKANDYYENNAIKAYCGNSEGITKKIEFTEANTKVTGEYLKSDYKTLKELKEYILTFIDESLINSKLELSDINNKKYNDNYYEIDGNLYCRNYSNKGLHSTYTNNYDIEVTEEREDKITANIAYEYLKEDSECNIDDLSDCSNSNFKYENGKIVIEKKNNNFIITKIDFHK